MDVVYAPANKSGIATSVTSPVFCEFRLAELFAGGTRPSCNLPFVSNGRVSAARRRLNKSLKLLQFNKDSTERTGYVSLRRLHRRNPAAMQSRRQQEVIHIPIEFLAAVIIGAPTLMIAFAMLVLKIVEVARSK